MGVEYQLHSLYLKNAVNNSILFSMYLAKQYTFWETADLLEYFSGMLKIAKKEKIFVQFGQRKEIATTDLSIIVFNLSGSEG